MGGSDSDHDALRVRRPEEVGVLPERLARVDEAAQRLLARGRSAVTVGIGRRGALVHLRCLGTTRSGGDEPVTDRSLFAIASVTKGLRQKAHWRRRVAGRVSHR